MSARLPRLGLLPRLLLPIAVGPIEWIEANVDMSCDVTAPTDCLIKLEPYQREPITSQFAAGTTEVIVMAPPQTGKSVCWRMAILYRISQDKTGPGWIMYESAEKADAINAEQLQPFVESIPSVFAKLRQGKKSILAGSYRLRDGMIEFGGAGTPPTSRSAKFAVGDELPTWPGKPDTKLKTLGNLRDRLRRFRQEPDCCLTIVGSPQGENDPIGDLFSESTAEHWTLRCAGCGKLSMPSHHIGNLQFRVDDMGMPAKSSIRLICPDCGRQHTEKSAQKMNDSGGYVARKRHPFRRGFQWGALASPGTYSWEEIAIRRLSANSKASLSVLVDYAKSILGMPYRPRSLTADREAALRDRCSPVPSPDDLAMILFSADTQDTGWYWVARAWSIDGESFAVGYGFAATLDALREAWNASYCGNQCAMGIIDEGGHRGKMVQEFVRQNGGLYTWKGSSQIGARYKITELDKERGWLEMLRITGNPFTYQAALLHELFVRTDREIDAAGNRLPTPNFLNLPDAPPPNDDDRQRLHAEYLEHLNSYQQNKKARNGHRFENYIAGDRPDHFFDCEKQLMCLIEHVENLYAQSLLPGAAWINPPRWIGAPKKPPRREPEGDFAG